MENNLRPELLPPKLDDVILAKGLKLAEKIESFLFMTPEEAKEPSKPILEEFNKYTTREYTIGDFDQDIELDEIVKAAFLPAVPQDLKIKREDCIELIDLVRNDDSDYVEYHWFKKLLIAYNPKFTNDNWIWSKSEWSSELILGAIENGISLD